MLESAQKIFSQYIDEPSRYSFAYIEITRGDNPEDMFYVCDISDKHYVVYETDYIGDLSFILRDVKRLFAVHDSSPLHWLVKKDHQEAQGASLLPAESTPATKQMRTAIIYTGAESYLRHVIIEIARPMSD